MIERISLARKLMVLIGLPLVGLLVMIGIAMSDRYRTYAEMEQVQVEARPALAVSALGRQVLKERVTSYLALSDHDAAKWSSELAAQRPETDKAIAEFEELFVDEIGYSDAIKEHLRRARTAVADLAPLRAATASRSISSEEAVARYSDIAQSLYDVLGDTADRCPDAALKAQLTSIYLMQHMMHFAGLENGYVQGMLSRGTTDANTLRLALRAGEARARYAETIRDLGDDEDIRRFDAAVGDRAALDRIVEELERAVPGEPLVVDGSAWWPGTVAMIDRVRLGTAEVNERAARDADARLEQLWRELVFYTVAGGGLLVLVVGVGWWLSRSISAALVGTGSRSQDVAHSIVSAVQQLSTATNETATMVAQTSTTVDEIRKTSEAAAQRAQEVADSAGRSRVASNDTRDAVRRGGEAMQNIRQDVEGIAQTIVELSSRTIQISEIVQSVGAIAEQSNLLAVNASIEAAKAGEYGRGFSVVASEVKALAQQSKEATDRIRQILAEIQKSSNAAVMITEQGVKRVEEGSELISEMGRGVDELANVIAHSADAASQILLTAREQVVGVEEIAQAMGSIEQATKENAAGAHQLESAATTVKAVAVQLGEIVHGRAA